MAMATTLREQTEVGLAFLKIVRDTTNDPTVRALLLKRIPEIEALIRTEPPRAQPRRIYFRKSMRRIKA